MLLTAAALIYLLITEKDKRVRYFLVYAPLILIVLFLCPLSRKVFVAAGLDGETYYRILWLIPMGLITATGACRAFAKHMRIGLAVSMVLIGLCGSLV